jgi:O-antigen ligase
MRFDLRNTPISKRSIDTTELSIAFFVFLSFCIQFFTHIIGSNVLLILILLLTGLMIFFLNFHKTNIYFFLSFLWLAALVAVTLSYFQTGLYISKYMDLFVFFAGILLIQFAGDNSDSFNLSRKVIIFFSFFYAVSIWVQVLAPSVYLHFANLLPESNRLEVVKWGQTGAYFTGFSSNPAFTAGHLVCGIFLLVAESIQKPKFKIQLNRVFPFAFLLLSLFLTGKRSHMLFLLVAVLSMYILPHKGRAFFIKIRNTIFILVFLLLLFLVFRKQLMTIPLFSRIIQSIADFLEGTDISSGRLPLYRHAWGLFKENPWFGIGWGNFRETTIGAVTLKTKMETHNIYLQLLAETGIVGFSFIVTPMLIMFYTTIRRIRQCVRYEKIGSWIALMYYSLAYQVFFLLYGVTGNGVYDPNFLMMYLFSAAITMSYMRYLQQESLIVFSGLSKAKLYRNRESTV